MDEKAHDAWWAIHSFDIIAVLNRARAGEDPDLLYLELIANSNTTIYPKDK